MIGFMESQSDTIRASASRQQQLEQPTDPLPPRQEELSRNEALRGANDCRQ